MSCCGTKIEARRNGDLRITYTPSSRKFTFSGLLPTLTVRLADATLLSVTTTPTVNGSAWTIVGDSMVLTLLMADIALLDSAAPDTDSELLNYDIVVQDQTGLYDWLLGGPFVVLGLNDVSCGSDCGDVQVSLNGQCVEVSIEGGNIGAASAVSLEELNQAVQDAETAASNAADSAQQASDAVATIPAMIAGKLDVDGLNADPDLLPNLALRPSSLSILAADPAAALDAVSPRLLTRGESITVTLPAGTIPMATPVSWQHPMSGAIKLRGQAPAAVSLLSINSVTGSAGAWVVTGTVNDASGISIGDGITIRNARPGWVAPGAYEARTMVEGEMRMQFFASGAISTVGTTATMTGSTGTTFLESGNIASILGENRAMSAVSASTFTLSSALAANAPSLQYWYALKHVTGTVSAAGTAVTGVGTAFLTKANIGDEIWIVGSGVRRITAIASNTSLTIDRPLTASSAAYGLMTCAWRHEGAFIVTGVSGNQMTWTNYNRSAQSQPPVNLVSGGDIAVYKTVLSATSSAFMVESGNILDIDNVFLTGPTGSTTVAFDLRGTGGGAAGKLRTGSNIGTAGFGYGVFTGVGSWVYAVNSAWSGQATRGVNVATQAFANLNGARISGVNGIGVFNGDGCSVRFNACISTGCADDGYRTEVQGGGWGDFSVSTHNGAKGYHWVGGSLVHLVGSWSIGNIEEGYIGENGGYGRMTGFLAASNSTGISGSGNVECQQASLLGNGNGLIATSVGSFNANTSAATYSVATGMQAIGSGTSVSTTAARVIGNAINGLAAQTTGNIGGSGTVFGDSGTSDANAVTGGWVRLVAPVNLTTTNITANAFQADGSLIVNGSGVVGQNYLEATGSPGVSVNAAAASVTALHTITVTGATLNDPGVTVMANIAMPANVSLTALVTAANTVTVYGTNPTAAIIAVSNRTYRVRVWK